MRVSKDNIFPSRVLNEDNDFITIEVAKHDGVEFTLQRNEENETVGGDRFLTLMFVKFENGQAVIWKPWEDGAN